MNLMIVWLLSLTTVIQQDFSDFTYKHYLLNYAKSCNAERKKNAGVYESARGLLLISLLNVQRMHFRYFARIKQDFLTIVSKFNKKHASTPLFRSLAVSIK